MAEGRRNLMVGVFVLAGVAALATLIVLFGRGPTWLVRGGTYPVYVRFDHAGGIREGTLVTVQGITIGRVEGVDVADLKRLDAGVEVLVAIESQYVLPQGATAQTTEPVLGQGRPPIELLVRGLEGQPPLQAGASITGVTRSAIDTIFPPGIVATFDTTARQIGDAADALTPVLEELEALLAARSPSDVDRPGGLQGNLTTALSRLDALLKHFNEVLGDPAVKSQLRDAIANLHAMSDKGTKVMSDLEAAAGDGRELMADARQLVSRADQTLITVDTRVTEVAQASVNGLDKIDQFMDHLNVIGAQVSSGQGNVGRLLMDSKLYEALQITVERLSLTVEEFRALIAEWRAGKIRVAL